MNTIEILKSKGLINKLEVLAQQKHAYIYRGQPDKDFSLIPSALRQDVMLVRLKKFPSTGFYEQWCSSHEFRIDSPAIPERIYSQFTC